MVEFDPIRRLKEIARDLDQIPVQKIPDEMGKICLFVINTYKSYRINLGIGPFHDAFMLARVIKAHGYQIFYLHNPHCSHFLQYLDLFLQRTTQHLIFSYVGHGTGVIDLNGDEADGMDEALVFDDGNIIDDDLIEHLVHNKSPYSRLTLLTDAAYKDTIWDMKDLSASGKPVPPNVVSLSAETVIPDNSFSMEQAMRHEQGAFQQGLSRVLKGNPDATPNDIGYLIENALREEGQRYTAGASTPSLLDEPFFL